MQSFRSVSFVVDLAADARLPGDFLSLVEFCLYPPLLLLGPITPYARFAAPRRPVPWRRTGRAMLRCLGYALLVELAVHTV